MKSNNELSGIQKLINNFIAQRDSHSSDPISEFKGSITNEGVKNLLEMAYKVSLKSEEGRYSQFRLFVIKEQMGNRSRKFINFNPPIALTSDVLYRLAPSVKRETHALR